MWEARVGMKCVCIAEDWEGGFWAGGEYFPSRVPMLNEVLTISRVNATDDGVFLFFMEIPERQGNDRGSAEFSYSIASFRPLRERPTDISIFRAILNGTHVPEDEHA